MHFNQGGYGLECLLTHPSVVEAVLEYVALGEPSLGTRVTRLYRDVTSQVAPGSATRFARGEIPPPWVASGTDRFSTHSIAGRRPGSNEPKECGPEDHFVFFDLAGESILEPIADDSSKFRVTMYNPELLA